MDGKRRNTAKTLRNNAGVKGSIGAEIVGKKTDGIIKRPEQGVEITTTPKPKSTVIA